MQKRHEQLRNKQCHSSLCRKCLSDVETETWISRAWAVGFAKQLPVGVFKSFGRTKVDDMIQNNRNQEYAG